MHRRFGHGPVATRQGIRHQDCVGAVVTYIREHGLKTVILVGHSFGGSMVQKVAEQFPDAIARAVFLDALILEDNTCIFDNLPMDYVGLLNALAEASSDNTMLIPWEIWRDNFIQDAPEAMARDLDEGSPCAGLD